MYDPRPPSLRSTSQGSIHFLREDLQKTGKDVVLVHLLPAASSTETGCSPSSLPPTPPVSRQHLLERLQSLPQPVSINDISTAGFKFVQSLQYIQEQRASIEKNTRSQAQSKRWFEERQFRLTAFKFGVIVKRKRQHTSLVHQLLYTTVNPSVSALQWGREHEADALHSYRQSLSDDKKLLSAVHKCGFLGASPDGVVIDASERLVCLVEVKCPFNAQDMTVEQHKNFLL